MEKLDRPSGVTGEEVDVHYHAYFISEWQQEPPLPKHSVVVTEVSEVGTGNASDLPPDGV